MAHEEGVNDTGLPEGDKAYYTQRSTCSWMEIATLSL